MRLLTSEPLLWRVLLTALLGAACATDLRARRIPNALVLVVFAAALLRAALITLVAPVGTMPGFAVGPSAAIVGALCGLALWLPLYVVGAFGAGDVKLFAAAAAWLGPSAVPGATLYAALAGGVLGLAWFSAQRLVRIAPTLARWSLRTLPTASGKSRVPYGVAITAGVLGVVWGGTP